MAQTHPPPAETGPVPPRADAPPDSSPAPVPVPNGRATAQDDRSIPDLLRELRDESSALVRQEVRLAKVEARQEVREAGAAVGSAVAGGAVAYVGLIALVIGLGWGLGELLGGAEWLGITIAGAVVALVGYLLLKRGRDKIQALTPPLDTTTQTLKEDKQWLKTQTP